MKTKGILLIIFFLINIPLFAQETRPFKKWRFGIIGGYQPVGVVYDYDKYSSGSGFVGGLSSQLNFTKKVSGLSLLFQPHWASFKQGYEMFGPSSSSGSYHDTWSTKSLNFPLLVRYALGKGMVRPYVEVGLNGRFRTSLKLKKEGSICGFAGCGGRFSSDNLQSDISQDHVGVIAGIGAELNLGKLTIPLSIRSNSVFGTDGTKTSSAYDSYYANLKTRTFQIVTGISF